MARRSDSYFMKRAGETKPWGAISFGSFSLGKQRKGTRQEAKNIFTNWQKRLNLVCLPAAGLTFLCFTKEK